MYKHNISEIEDVGIIIRRVSPMWMDYKGTIVDKGSAYGCKVIHEIVRHNYCVVVDDEVRNNILMKGDGHTGGQKCLCEKGTIPQQKALKKDNHFTLL